MIWVLLVFSNKDNNSLIRFLKMTVGRFELKVF